MVPALFVKGAVVMAAVAAEAVGICGLLRLVGRAFGLDDYTDL